MNINYDKYIKYIAYKVMYREFMNNVIALDVERPSCSTLELTLKKSYDIVANSIENVNISLKDDIETLIKKKMSAEENEKYLNMLHDAYMSYKNIISCLSRPTVKQVEKRTIKILCEVTTDLLML